MWFCILWLKTKYTRYVHYVCGYIGITVFPEITQIVKIVFFRNPGKFREIPEIPGKSPENPAGKFGVFSYFQAVIAYKRL